MNEWLWYRRNDYRQWRYDWWVSGGWRRKTVKAVQELGLIAWLLGCYVAALVGIAVAMAVVLVLIFSLGGTSP